jgi:hypothetical protein
MQKLAADILQSQSAEVDPDAALAQGVVRVR